MEYGNGTTNQLVWQSSDNRYHNADFQVTEDNLNVNVAMLAKYVSSGSLILDVGCGEGKLGAVLRHKNCQLYGIDLDHDAGRFAVEHCGYQEVLYFNIEDSDSEKYLSLKRSGLRFDIIALIDILEHVINPTRVIQNIVPLLKENGQILISIPNVNNADILLNLLRDHFNYREAGVLDNTHAKYFTKTSFLQWIRQMNDLLAFDLDCEYVGSTYGYTDFLASIKLQYPAVYQFVQLNPYFHAIQHLFVLHVSQHKGQRLKKHLDLLLEEEAPNLIAALESSLQENVKSPQQFGNITLLPNERQILEQQVQSSTQGWETCSQALTEAKERIAILEKELEKAAQFSNKQEKSISELKNALNQYEKNALSSNGQKKYNEKLSSATEGWKKCSQALDEAKERIAILEKELAKAVDFQNLQEKNIAELKNKLSGKDIG